MQNLAQDAFVRGFADVTLNQKLARGEVVAQFAGDNAHFARLDDNVRNNLSLPPNGTVEMPPGPPEFFKDANFSFLGGLTQLSLLAIAKDERTLVAELQAVTYHQFRYYRQKYLAQAE